MSHHNLWIICFIFIGVLFAANMILSRKNLLADVSMKEAGTWVGIWIAAALIFNGLVWYAHVGSQGPAIAQSKGLEFFTGYFLEWILSVDNVFVMLFIFQYFHIPSHFQKKVLLYSVVIAVVLRILFILFGQWLISMSSWVLILFGIILLFAGMQMLLSKHEQANYDDNKLMKWLYKHMRVTPELVAEKFFERKNGLLYVTPLFVAFIFLAIADVIFAVDSVPAIFAITMDPLIIITSNVFAIMGLRSLYFLVAHMAQRFQMLKYAIGIILLFVAVKIIFKHWIEIPIVLTLLFIMGVLIGGIVVSLVYKREA